MKPHIAMRWGKWWCVSGPYDWWPAFVGDTPKEAYKRYMEHQL